MTSIVIAAAEQSIAYDLRAALSEMDAVEALFVVESTSDLVSTVLRLDPDVVLVHDRLGLPHRPPDQQQGSGYRHLQDDEHPHEERHVHAADRTRPEGVTVA
jgi:hypothetical protein